jgi:hypothetical protein
VARLELRCETASTLLLRGVLKPDNPQHRAILDKFQGKLMKWACHASWHIATHHHHDCASHACWS